ncbi:MAG: hypothetical protein PHV34_24205 [Verrucomicrobiae bacterium]|nr:hypothetical protein [Verrucomicrobiae bacterium]
MDKIKLWRVFLENHHLSKWWVREKTTPDKGIKTRSIGLFLKQPGGTYEKFTSNDDFCKSLDGLNVYSYGGRANTRSEKMGEKTRKRSSYARVEMRGEGGGFGYRQAMLYIDRVACGVGACFGVVCFSAEFGFKGAGIRSFRSMYE